MPSESFLTRKCSIWRLSLAFRRRWAFKLNTSSAGAIQRPSWDGYVPTDRRRSMSKIESTKFWPPRQKKPGDTPRVWRIRPTLAVEAWKLLNRWPTATFGIIAPSGSTIQPFGGSWKRIYQWKALTWISTTRNLNRHIPSRTEKTNIIRKQSPALGAQGYINFDNAQSSTYGSATKQPEVIASKTKRFARNHPTSETKQRSEETHVGRHLSGKTLIRCFHFGSRFFPRYISPPRNWDELRRTSSGVRRLWQKEKATYARNRMTTQLCSVKPKVCLYLKPLTNIAR